MMARALLCMICLAASVAAAPAASPGNWPCVQRKVSDISIAAIWQGPPIGPEAAKWRGDPEVAALAERLAIRRTSEDEAGKAITAFAAAPADIQTRLLMVVAGLVELVNDERSAVVAGLERYGDGQKQIAELVRRENAELAALRNTAAPDPAQVAQLSEKLTWDLRIFQERQTSLRYVCEVPVLIEQRLFALSRQIQKALETH